MEILRKMKVMRVRKNHVRKQLMELRDFKSEALV